MARSALLRLVLALSIGFLSLGFVVLENAIRSKALCDCVPHSKLEQQPWQHPCNDNKKQNRTNEHSKISLIHEQLAQFHENNSTFQQEFSYAYRRTSVVDINDITLVTQGSISKLPRLVGLAQRWGGPISCAFVLSTSKEAQEFDSVMSSNALLQSHVTIHFLLEAPGNRHPVNRLRNLALRNVESDYVFVNDLDFIPNVKAHSALQSELSAENPLKNDKKLWILPAFERFGTSSRGPGRFVTNVSLIPETKQQLMEMVQVKVVEPFHAYYSPGHGPTNYARWYNEKKSVFSYPVRYEYLFEPYVIGYRYGLPPFFADFRGFGFNKATWFVEVDARGYTMEVLVEHFVCHMNHKGRKKRRDKGGDSHIQKERFKEYMHRVYGTSLKELAKW